MSSPTVSSIVENCHAIANASFHSDKTTMDQFRIQWDRIMGMIILPPAPKAEEEASSSSTTTRSNRCIEQWLVRLWELHTEPTRHYHTVVHLEEMMEYYHLIRQRQQEKQHQEGDDAFVGLTDEDDMAIVLSIYFHDAIYNPHSPTNEEDSEKLWRSFAQDVGLQSSSSSFSSTHGLLLVEKVSRFILATKKHVVSPKNEKGLALFLDLDLAVLAKEPDAYMSYAALIRREYHFVPEHVYCSKRAEILQSMANQERLYGSPMFLPLEERARANLRREVDLLQQGTIPC